MIDHKKPLEVYINEDNKLRNYKKLKLNYIEYFPTFNLKRTDEGFMIFYKNFVDNYNWYKDELCFEKDLRYEKS